LKSNSKSLIVIFDYQCKFDPIRNLILEMYIFVRNRNYLLINEYEHPIALL